MTPTSRANWQRVIVTVIVCMVVGAIIFVARWIVHTQQNSATLAAAERLVVFLEDHHTKYGTFPGSLTNLFMDSASPSNSRPPEVLGRFDYRSDGRSYELKFEAGRPVVLTRKASPTNQASDR